MVLTYVSIMPTKEAANEVFKSKLLANLVNIIKVAYGDLYYTITPSGKYKHTIFIKTPQPVKQTGNNTR